MKKKFLSLMMAAAVVATTSVSAFAADKVIDSADDKEAQSEVQITGKVQDESGTNPVGTFKVTVPTTTNFTVTKKGTVISANLDIKNAGAQGIDVYAYKFFDESGDEEINIVSETTLTPSSTDNNNVALKLTSSIGSEVAYLSSDSSKGGVYTNPDLSTPANDLGGVKLLTLLSGTDQSPTAGQIRLEGVGGQQAVEDPISDNFKLTLKIKKAGN